MWRAWGILLLGLSQDTGERYFDPEHEFSIRPPVEWKRLAGHAPQVVRFSPPRPTRLPCELGVTHYHSPNPTPLQSFVAQAKEYVLQRFNESRTSEEKDLTLAGRPAHRMVFTEGEILHVKTIVRRTNTEYYLVDAKMAAADAAVYRVPAERAIASFEIVLRGLDDDERAAFSRWKDVLGNARVRPELLGESWHEIYLSGRKIGQQRTKVSESGRRYAFEMDLRADFGDGGSDSSIIRGAFSPDGRFQKVDTERTKKNKTERWKFRASVILEAGRVEASREMGGYEEKAAFAAEDGVLFDDVADVMRRAVVLSGKGTYLLRTLSAYDDEPDAELMEVNEAEPIELDGRKQPVHVVFSRVDRRKNVTYYFDRDGRLLRMGSLKDSFHMKIAP